MMEENIFNKKMFLLCSGIFICVGLSVYSETFSSMLFLTKYPPEWLAYYYALQGAMTLGLAKNAIKAVKVLQNGSNPRLFLIIVFYLGLITFLIYFPNYYLTIIACILIKILASVTGLSIWGIVSNILDIRTFKKHSGLLNLSGTIGAITVGSLIPIVIISQPNQSMLLLLSGLLLTLYIIRSKLIRYYNHNEQPCDTKQTASLGIIYQRPLMKVLSIFTFIVLLSCLLVDYVFKSRMALNYNETEIGNIVSMVFIVVNVSNLLIQLLILPTFLRKFSVAYCAGILPFILCVFAIIILFLPSTILVILFYSVMLIAFYSFYSNSDRLLLNALPSLVRELGRIHIKAYITPLVFLVSGLFAWVFNLANSHIYPLIVLLFACSGAVALVFSLKKHYFTELKQALSKQRYAEVFQTPLENEVMLQMANHAIKKNDEKNHLFVLGILQRLPPDHIKINLRAMIDSGNDEVRRGCLEILSVTYNKKYLIAVKERFDSEVDEVSKWYAYIYLVNNSVGNMATTVCNEMQQDSDLYFAMLAILSHAKHDSQMLQKSIEHLYERNSQQAKVWLLRVLDRIHIVCASKYIIPYLSASEPHIVTEAIKLIRKYDDADMIRVALQLLADSRYAYLVIKHISQIKKLDTKLLHQFFMQNNEKPFVQRAIIIILSEHPSGQAETLLIKLLEEYNILNRNNIAKYLAFRHLHYAMDEQSRQLIEAQLYNEFSYYNCLLYASKQASISADQHYEIKQRIFLTMKRCLYWTVAITADPHILNIMPNIYRVTNAHIKAKAIEALEVVFEEKPDIKKGMLSIFENQKIQVQTALIEAELKIIDPLLYQVLSADTEEAKMLQQEIVLFRQFSFCKNLSLEVIMSLAKDFERKAIVEKQIIFNQDEEGDGFYLIIDGEVTLNRDGTLVKTLGKGHYFGELALIDKAKRTMSAVASTDSVLYFLNTRDFNRLCDELPEIMRQFLLQTIDYYRNSIS